MVAAIAAMRFWVSPRPATNWASHSGIIWVAGSRWRGTSLGCRKVGRSIALAYVCRHRVSASEQAMTEFKDSHFERDVILWAVRWYVAYQISYHQLEEMMAEHGVEVDHATSIAGCPSMSRCWSRNFEHASSRWVPAGEWTRLCEGQRQLEVLVSGRRQGWCHGGFLLTAKRDRKAALRFLRKAIKWNGTPEKITIDRSGANTAAIRNQSWH
jgi:DDE domain